MSFPSEVRASLESGFVAAGVPFMVYQACHSHPPQGLGQGRALPSLRLLDSNPVFSLFTGHFWAVHPAISHFRLGSIQEPLALPYSDFEKVEPSKAARTRVTRHSKTRFTMALLETARARVPSQATVIQLC